ncbi:MAG: ribosomal RNA small subunit methyltransferase A [Sedimentisphaerales bacterium]|nr:ribosomal RNA small subunit methyltransferase A [Sedimentisphaerales bacterium]
MQTKHQIQELLSTAGVSPLRRLGQHFLIDLNLMRLLVDSAQLRRTDVVLEVGCGTGSLTQALAEQAGAVVAVEIDQRLARIAESQVAGRRNVRIINADVLSGKGAIHPGVVEALEHARRRLEQGGSGGSSGRLVLVSNLPYDVASPVMIHLARGPVVADAMCVTVQKEVAERMTAGPGSRDYGTLSIFLQATGRVEILRVLKPNVFWPAPRVESALVRFVRDEHKSRQIQDMGVLSDVVGLFMGHRRKMLRACVKTVPTHLGRPDLWLRILAQHGVDPTLRPGDLAPAQYVELANAWRQSAPLVP